MRVIAAGATGAIGKQLVLRLVAAGHEVHGRTRSESKRAMLYELGAVPVVADARYALTGAAVKGEKNPFDASPNRVMRANVTAICYLEEAVLGATGRRGLCCATAGSTVTARR
jgi:nucleoside-diphosphate-sugar epimerase